MSKRDLYWCDNCAKKTVDNKGNDTLIWWGGYASRDYSKHLKTKKHKASLAKDIGNAESVTCGKCNGHFSEAGYINHEKRNKELWGFQKIGMLPEMTCNNFNEGKKRYGSMKEVRSSRDQKPKQKRVRVGKISPITGFIRKPNKPDNYSVLEAQKLDEHYYLCKKCDKMVNDTTLEYSDKELMEKTNKIMCICPEDDTPNIVMTVSGNDDVVDEEDIVTIKCNDVDLTEEDYKYIDKYGSNLSFDDICDGCSMPINYDFSEQLLTTLDIETCGCD